MALDHIPAPASIGARRQAALTWVEANHALAMVWRLVGPNPKAMQDLVIQAVQWRCIFSGIGAGAAGKFGVRRGHCWRARRLAASFYGGIQIGEPVVYQPLETGLAVGDPLTITVRPARPRAGGVGRTGKLRRYLGGPCRPRSEKDRA
jgi:hypothetical protein